MLGRLIVGWDRQQSYYGNDPDLAVYAALIALNDAVSAHASKTDAVLHGGCVDADGRAVAFVGHSASGKSTLTAGLVRAGFGYIADEVTVVDTDHRVRPYHRPIGIRSGSDQLLDIERPAGPFGRVYPLRVGDGWGRLSEGAPLGAVLLLDRADRPTRPAATLVRPAEALYLLCDQTLGTMGAEATAFRRLERLVRDVPVFKYAYTDYRDVVEDLPGVMTRVG